MKKLIVMAFILASFAFVSSCSFFSGSRSTASAESQCVALSPDSGFNIQNVCVGERSYIAKTKTSGKIIEIDISGMDNDKAETIFFLVEDKEGHKIRMTGKDIILNKKELCIESPDDELLCVGDRFNALSDGNDRTVLGFSMSTLSEQYVNVYTIGSIDNLTRKESPWNIFSSIIATKTGMIEDVASCREAVLLKTDSGLIKCAKKELIKKIDKVCDVFRHGNGRVVADIESKNIKTECSKEYSMFGASTKTCTAELIAKCERTKQSDGLVIVQSSVEPSQTESN
ncbi:MAG: hypothetical protein H7336_01955 [Bacteriovorax sp.]|nr:hypothetical protein [Bacteriovorax sp.]